MRLCMKTEWIQCSLNLKSSSLKEIRSRIIEAMITIDAEVESAAVTITTIAIMTIATIITTILTITTAVFITDFAVEVVGRDEAEAVAITKMGVSITTKTSAKINSG